MGKLADALDKAGYGDDDFLGVEKQAPAYKEEPRRKPIRLLKRSTPRHSSTPDEIAIDIPEIAEPESEKKPAHPIKKASTQSTETTFRTKPALIKSKSVNSEGAWDERLFKAVNNDIHFPEIFKMLRTRLLHPKDGKPAPKTIVVTAVSPREGKSFIAANLGITLAQGVDASIPCWLTVISAARDLQDYLASTPTGGWSTI